MKRGLWLIGLPVFALAHEGQAPEPHDLWRAWVWDPGIVLPLALSAWLYWRGARPEHGTTRREQWAFWTGWMALALALVSPIHSAGEALFSAHMLQHEILMLVAAPLLVLGRPLVPFLWGLPFGWRRAVGGAAKSRPVAAAWLVVSAPLSAWILHAAAIWLWHAPSLFQATLESDLAHTLQHLSFLGSALLFWWSLIAARKSYGAGVIYVFTTAVHTSLLGALLTFAPHVWYPAYNETAAWGLTPLEDQQLGGLIMWVPAGIVYIAAGLLLIVGWLRQSERCVREIELARRAVLPVLLLVLLTTTSCGSGPVQAAARLTGGDPERGRQAIARYGCAACHTIAGVQGAHGLTGPPLTGIASRVYLAGVLTNTPDHLIRWIRNPKAVDEKTAMPDLGVTPQDARDISAYLYTLK